MRVLVLQSELGVLRGGGENFTRNLFDAFARRGHQVAAAFVADHKGRYPISLPSSIEPIPIPGWWSRKMGQAALSSMCRRMPFYSRHRVKWDRVQEAICWRTIRWHSRRFERRVEREFDQRWREYDAVFVHGNSMLASRVARRRPAVLRLTGPVTAELVPVLRSVHAVCANGDAFVRIRAFLGDHAVNLPIGLDEQLFRPGESSVRPALGWTHRHRVIGYVGRLTHLKGVDLLADAFRTVSQRTAEARLLIVGSGEEESNIRALLSREIAQGLVHVQRDVGHESLPEWYRAMDVLVMPSRYENFSNALLEGMATGIPFLASDVGGNRMLAEGGAGWLFTPGSVSSLASLLEDVIVSGAQMKARGAIACQYVQGRFSWSATAECLESIMRSRLNVTN